MSKQPHVEPPDTQPLSSIMAVWMCDNMSIPWVLMDKVTIEEWIRIAGCWEKLVAEFQAARNEDQAEIAYWKEKYDGTLEAQELN